ncbi:MAG: cupin domain-containing protein [Bryobacteraceae bacterium]
MKHKLLLLSGFALVSVMAADPAGFVYWPKGAPPSAGPKSARFDNHSLSVSHRDKNGVAELHENQTDIMVVESGEATLVAGGEVVDPKNDGHGEVRGPSIKNGVKKNLSAGDVVHIPAGMPHQFFLAPGQQITYFVVKVNKP